ncbi:hypothetical protein E8L99_15055 [Phreatobacter aquaticus]|uniref:Uncharacterized protein n=1 Tax=Phreatobacter aquaticus TaxID=2570229 RepID=A0A4D7QK31_9HYPH|nr:hypothetical protein [Phreatobacter aquaticus]QCK86981.1 hypothetical protein E8L99_15055 [Phreatobacter aquaticus]
MSHSAEAATAAALDGRTDFPVQGFEDRLYDPEQERAVARRLRGVRWRRLMVTGGALALAAAGATGLTLASRDAVQGSVRTETVATTTPAPVTAPILQVGPQPAASPDTPPVLSSASSTPARLVTPPASDPNKLQERIATATPATPEPLGAARAFSPPTDSNGTTPEGIRRIPLAAGGRALVPAQGEQPASPAVAAVEPTQPMAATAPLPPRRPNRAP